MRLRLSAILFLVGFCLSSQAQLTRFGFKRKLSGIHDTWHLIELPDEVFGKVRHNLSDIRVYGITDSDTIEAPYILRRFGDNNTDQVVEFKVINTSRNRAGYFYTFEVPTRELINQLHLTFNQSNFDWRVKLEGSENLTEWFTILENYRIVSIKNEFVSYSFTRLVFPDSRYRYFRLAVPAGIDPGLASSRIFLETMEDKDYKDIPVKGLRITEDKNSRRTVVEADAELTVPITSVRLHVRDTFDYYRPATIEYLSDSFRTDSGWRYVYTKLAFGAIGSIGESAIEFDDQLARRLRITIDNADNEPLQIENVVLKGTKYELIVRLTQPADYFLAYGGADVRPTYDIERFVEKIPAEVNELVVGPEELVELEEEIDVEPFFINSYWLYAVMAIVIGLLGWFTLSMMKKR